MTDKTGREAVTPRMITRISPSIYRKRGEISNGGIYRNFRIPGWAEVWKSPAFIGYCTKQGIQTPLDRRTSMAKTKYTFEKRQRDLAKKKKKEEKLQRKLERKTEKPAEIVLDENGVPIETTPADPESESESETGPETGGEA
jgi:hypothetical protein